MLDAKRRIDARRFPTRAAGPDLHLVFQRDDGRGRDRRGGARDRHRPVPGSGQAAADQLAAPRQPVHAAVADAQAQRAGADHAAVPRAALPRQPRGLRRAHGLDRLGTGGVVWRRLVLPPGLRSGLPDITTGWSGFGLPGRGARGRGHRRGDPRGPAGALQALPASIDPDGGRPPLDYVHVLLPHVPWCVSALGRARRERRDIPGLTADYRWTPAATVALQRLGGGMLLQARYADRLLGHLLRRLTRPGARPLGRRRLLADHGAAMRPGDLRRRFRPGPWASWAGAGFIKAPGQHHGRTMTKHVRTLDVVPTIAALKVGARLPWHTDGRSTPRRRRYPEPTRLRFHRVFGGVDVDVSRRGAWSAGARVRWPSRCGCSGRVRRSRASADPRAATTWSASRPPRSAPAPGDAAPVVASPEQFENVDPPARWFRHIVTGGGPRPRRGRRRQVAVEVNGRVAAVGREPRPERRPGLRGMIPDAVFRRRRNDVRAVVFGERVMRASS